MSITVSYTVSVCFAETRSTPKAQTIWHLLGFELAYANDLVRGRMGEKTKIVYLPELFFVSVIAWLSAFALWIVLYKLFERFLSLIWCTVFKVLTHCLTTECVRYFIVCFFCLRIEVSFTLKSPAGKKDALIALCD